MNIEPDNKKRQRPFWWIVPDTAKTAEPKGVIRRGTPDTLAGPDGSIPDVVPAAVGETSTFQGRTT